MGWRTYSELIKIPSFEERYEYLKLGGGVGHATFGGHRYFNQRFYTSKEWRTFRRDIIDRDCACDLAINDGLHDIPGKIIIHHLNPITIDDISNVNLSALLNPNNVVCVSHKTHEAIHYGSRELIESYAMRTPGDTKLW